MNKKNPLLIAGAGGLLVLGFAAGAGAGATSGEPQTPTPAVTVTAEPKVRTEVKEKRVEVTPPSCRLALDQADRGFNTFAEVMQALLDGDTSAADAANAKLTKLAPQYNAAKAECRGL